MSENCLDHPCKNTCSGWIQGYEKAQRDMKDRERKLVEALEMIALHEMHGAANMRHLAKTVLEELGGDDE